jgi:hypothetical protein
MEGLTSKDFVYLSQPPNSEKLSFSYLSPVIKKKYAVKLKPGKGLKAAVKNKGEASEGGGMIIIDN